MPDLQFRIEGAEVARYAATPLLNFKLRVTNGNAAEIANVNLQCQIQIEAVRRPYRPDEQFKLQDLFGESQRWDQTLRTMLWTRTSILIPSFENECLLDLPVACTFDFNVVTTKYFHALEEGDIPLSFQFSGSIFYRGKDGGLQVGQIPWDRDIRFKLPVALWREMIEHYYPNGAWLCLNRDVFDRLYEYKIRHGLPSWEAAMEHALDHSMPRTNPYSTPNTTLPSTQALEEIEP
ncbi:MAG: DUF6084 family protein [Burkholderiaceae bacterium]